MKVSELAALLMALPAEKQNMTVRVENGLNPSDMEPVTRVITKPDWENPTGESVCIEST